MPGSDAQSFPEVKVKQHGPRLLGFWKALFAYVEDGPRGQRPVRSQAKNRKQQVPEL